MKIKFVPGMKCRAGGREYIFVRKISLTEASSQRWAIYAPIVLVKTLDGSGSYPDNINDTCIQGFKLLWEHAIEVSFDSFLVD